MSDKNQTIGNEFFDAAHYFLHEKHFLQTSAWGAFQQKMGNKTLEADGVSADGGEWSYMAIEEHGQFSSRLYCPYGPFFTTMGAFEDALHSLITAAKAKGLEFVRLEPRSLLTEEDFLKRGLKKARRGVQPPDTIINDVRAEAMSAEDIIAHTSTLRRRLYRKGEKEGVQYDVSYDPADIRHFIDMIHDVSDRTGMHPHPDAYFERMAEVLFPLKKAGLLIAKLDGKPISTILIYTDGTTMSYAHAANFSEYRKISPASGLFSYALLYARETGHTLFDSYGVAPVGAPESHSWSGFTAFKESFGGVRVHYPGTWEFPVRKVRYAAYRLIAKILGK
ncbi:MAG: peptidoglycan bridge formation glycyltransferase FemA/FemB family protein [Clostridiales Family XIII bacterium]|jgi:lipid II:glycine glycyltransferase (peptidoglycan interpeptide bridge formation enzyme)|nr:peptidoglycan bridge formation glycyltransferase FemA/FemB family protein [Clostridiales Family XIII bacterium]